MYYTLLFISPLQVIPIFLKDFVQEGRLYSCLGRLSFFAGLSKFVAD